MKKWTVNYPTAMKNEPKQRKKKSKKRQERKRKKKARLNLTGVPLLFVKTQKISKTLKINLPRYSIKMRTRMKKRAIKYYLSLTSLKMTYEKFSFKDGQINGKQVSKVEKGLI